MNSATKADTNVDATTPAPSATCPYCGETGGSHDRAYPHPRASQSVAAAPAAQAATDEQIEDFECAMKRLGYDEGMFSGFYAEGELTYYDKMANCMFDAWCAALQQRQAPAPDLAEAYSRWFQSQSGAISTLAAFQAGHELAQQAEAAPVASAEPIIDVWINPQTLQRSLLDHGTPLAPFDKREFVGSLVWSTDPQDAPINAENIKFREKVVAQAAPAPADEAEKLAYVIDYLLANDHMRWKGFAEDEPFTSDNEEFSVILDLVERALKHRAAPAQEAAAPVTELVRRMAEYIADGAVEDHYDPNGPDYRACACCGNEIQIDAFQRPKHGVELSHKDDCLFIAAKELLVAPIASQPAQSDITYDAEFMDALEAYGDVVTVEEMNSDNCIAARKRICAAAEAWVGRASQPAKGDK